MASRNLILRNFWWKLLSLLVAALAWLLIDTEVQKSEQQAKAMQEVETDSRRPFYDIPITLLTSPANTNRFAVTPEVVSVEVGSKDSKALDDLQAHRVQAFVDVTDAEDEKQFRKPIQINVPGEFVVLAVAPTNAIVERITGPRQH
jgi:hypothetical protein